MDIGAACITETPVYKPLLDHGLAHLHAFEGDERQIAKIQQAYNSRVTVYRDFVFDGTRQTVYLASEASGMTSLLRPRESALRFFNGFTAFGRVLDTASVQTTRLDDVKGLVPIDFVKLDIQGAELTVLKHGSEVLRNCLAVQLEVSFVELYEDQPSFGEVDTWMRSQGFMPHRFLDIKRWSIAPTVRDNNIRLPFNQLLEADVVYIRDPLKISEWSDQQLRMAALLAHESFVSPDLAMHFILELDRRGVGGRSVSLKDQYLTLLSRSRSAPA
jgi:FkbM family methyltransferase